MDRVQKRDTNIGALHIISTGQQSPETLAGIVEQIIDHIDAIHLREKLWSDKQMTETILLLHSKGIPLEKIVVNHQAAIAHVMNTKGVQLTHNSNDAATIRHAYPDLHLGRSVHSVQEAVDACNRGADYVIFGHVFATRSKPDLQPKGLAELRNVVQLVNIPVLAIGGITPENTPDIIKTGASGIAVLSGVLLAHDPFEKVMDYTKALKKGDKQNV
ncbi:thiazole tautomerase (transcriptional regulator TenI) [Lentibacillus halodurans]|uniref:Thiazole tautomerase (Transcriptional regulator TenI) n=2 Tax=Lentibacillus halodurans TaxID=237679 RepID=A0A1I0ZLG9_9BACI|nr:thiazole tautomerase (transcriptional regulator TenI) [Lentibacillus halodurans]